MAGRINALATPFIPGDSDRDGDCDTDDIVKIAAIFGDDDWIFSNSYNAAPEGDSGDPAMQTRPWDVDATGDNGIEASDLQWTLNFQGDTTGQIVGVRYSSTTPAGSGVVLNSGASVGCTITAAFNVLSGRTLSTLKVGDRVELTVSVQVTSGANTSAGEENGVMQFVHDIVMSTGGVLQVMTIEPQSPFVTTRPDIQVLAGANGDEGVDTVNGYTTSFSEGLTGQVELYSVTLAAKALGSTGVTVSPASAGSFAASTPHGVKIGHTDQNGNPNAVVYPASEPASVTSTVRPDVNDDGDVDEDDFTYFSSCVTGPTVLQADPNCRDHGDLDDDNDIDQKDFGVFQRCYTGPDQGPPPQDCDEI